MQCILKKRCDSGFGVQRRDRFSEQHGDEAAGHRRLGVL